MYLFIFGGFLWVSNYLTYLQLNEAAAVPYEMIMNQFRSCFVCLYCEDFHLSALGCHEFKSVEMSDRFRHSDLIQMQY